MEAKMEQIVEPDEIRRSTVPEGDFFVELTEQPPPCRGSEARLSYLYMVRNRSEFSMRYFNWSAAQPSQSYVDSHAITTYTGIVS
jgi:hypothetical protein